MFTLMGTLANSISMIVLRLYKDGIKNDSNLQYFYLSQVVNASLNFIIF